MTAKPTLDDTRIAVDAGGVDGPNLIEPDGDLKDDGYPLDAVPTSGNFNWHLRKLHQWPKFLDQLFDGADPPNATLPAGLDVTGGSTLRSKMRFLDGAGNRRALVDHLGFRTGRVHEVCFDWNHSVLDAAHGWSVTNLFTLSSQFGSSPVRGLVADFDGATFNSGSLTSFAPILYPSSADTVAVLEFDAIATGLAGTSGTTQVIAGFSSSPVADGAFYLQAFGSSGFWSVLTDDSLGSASTVVTSVPLVNGAVVRARLEIIGSALPGGTRAVAYLNGTAVSTNTTKVPNQPLYLRFSSSRVSGAATPALQVSPVRLRVAYGLSDDDL